MRYKSKALQHLNPKDDNEWPTITLGQVVKVTATRLTQSGYYRYHAHLVNGNTVVVRKKATRLYANAFLYRDATGNGSGLLAHFGFGKKPATHRHLVRTFPIIPLIKRD
jgi:hypothetical protein